MISYAGFIWIHLYSIHTPIYTCFAVNDELLFRVFIYRYVYEYWPQLFLFYFIFL